MLSLVGLGSRGDGGDGVVISGVVVMTSGGGVVEVVGGGGVDVELFVAKMTGRGMIGDDDKRSVALSEIETTGGLMDMDATL